MEELPIAYRKLLGATYVFPLIMYHLGDPRALSKMKTIESLTPVRYNTSIFFSTNFQCPQNSIYSNKSSDSTAKAVFLVSVTTIRNEKFITKVPKYQKTYTITDL